MAWELRSFARHFNRGWLVAAAAILLSDAETTSSPPAASLPAPIPVTDIAALKPLLGQRIVVTGTVADIAEGSTGYRRVKFRESRFILYIGKGDVAAHPDWKWDEWKGKTIFAGGELKEYLGQWELIVKSPSQIADDPSKIVFPAAAAKPASGGEAVPAIEVKKASTTISQVSAVIDGAAQPYLAFERFGATFEPGSRGAGAPIRIESYAGKDRTSAVAGLEAVRRERGWPRNRILAIKRVHGGRSGPGLPHGLAVALMLGSLIDGWDVPEALAVGGSVVGAGSLAGGCEELLILARTPPPDGIVLLVPDGAEVALADLALDGKWDSVLNRPVLGARSLKDAARLVQAFGRGELTPVMTQFSEVAAAVRKNPATALKSPALRARLTAITHTCPEHLTARMLLALGSKEAPATYSVVATGLKLRQFYARALVESKALRAAKVPESRKKLRTLESELKALLPKCHKDWKRFQDVLVEWIDAMQDSLKFDKKDTSSRAKKVADRLKRFTEKAKIEDEEAAKIKQ